MFDINAIQSVKAIDYEVVHPITGVKLGATIQMLGDSHNDRRNAVREYNRALRRIGEGDTAEQIDARREAHSRYIASCLSGWSGIAEDGNEIEFSQKAAIELLQKPELDWLLSQVSMALIDQKNFIAAQPKP